MENASKALIIAGAILIALLIISLGIFMFNKMGGSAKDAANMDEQEIANFNSKITPYVGKNVSGSQVNALIQYIISVNTSAANAGDKTKSVTISFPVTTSSGGSGTNTISVGNGAGGQLTVTYANTAYPKRVNTGASNYYKVEVTHGSSGLISEIKVTK